MSETVTKKLTVTFNDGLPLGIHATFKHEGQHWVAFPAEKQTRITTVSDRLIGILSRLQNELTAWLSNTNPKDTERITRILGILALAEEYKQQSVRDKVQAATA